MIRERLKLYGTAGIGILRADVEWRQMERSPGQWSDPAVLPLLELAVQTGMKLKLNVSSLSGPPAWYFREHPDAQMVNVNGQRSDHVVSYWYPGLHALLEDKDDKLFAALARYHLLDAVAYVVVPFGPAGEPLYPPAWTTAAPHENLGFWYADPHARDDFAHRMAARWGSLNAANRRWGTEFPDWASVTLPAEPSGPLRDDIVDWYRDSKRGFLTWQVAHYRRLLRKYDRHAPPRLLLLVGGDHPRAPGGEAEKMMVDSKFVLDLAQRAGASAQYTGMPNLVELQYLERHLREHHAALPLWGENAGNQGDPAELDREVTEAGLFGQEYIGDNLFAADHVTPTPRFAALAEAHRQLLAQWAQGGREHPVHDAAR